MFKFCCMLCEWHLDVMICSIRFKERYSCIVKDEQVSMIKCTGKGIIIMIICKPSIF